MSLSMEKRMKLASQASADLAFSRLREADGKLNDGISWVLCSCRNRTAQRSWMRMQVARPRPSVRRKLLLRLGALLLAAAAFVTLLIFEAAPILRALNY